MGCIVHVIRLPTSDGFLTSFLIKSFVSLCLKFPRQANEQDGNELASGKHFMFFFERYSNTEGEIWKKTLLFVRREI